MSHFKRQPYCVHYFVDLPFSEMVYEMTKRKFVQDPLQRIIEGGA